MRKIGSSLEGGGLLFLFDVREGIGLCYYYM